MKNKRYKKELTEEVNRTNIVISDKIIHNKYVIILCKNKWKKLYGENRYEIRIITKSDRRREKCIFRS